MEDAAQNAGTERYIWHLRPPFSELGEKHFDAEPWWKDAPEDSFVVEATYEVLRRHPNMRNYHLTGRAFGPEMGHQPSPFAYCLSILGLRTWKDLHSGEQQWFREVLRAKYPGKNRDFKPVIQDITTQSIHPNFVE